MKKKILILFFVFALLFTGCKSGSTEVQKFCFPENLINISGNTPEEFKNELESSKDTYKAVTLNDDNTVTLELKNNQVDTWKQHRKDIIKQIISEMEALNKNYKLEVNDDCTEVKAFYDMAANYDEQTMGSIINYILYADLMCGAYQILDGVEPENWSVSLSVYNCDTRKLVGKAVSPGENLVMNYDDWRKSL